MQVEGSGNIFTELTALGPGGTELLPDFTTTLRLHQRQAASIFPARGPLMEGDWIKVPEV